MKSKSFVFYGPGKGGFQNINIKNPERKEILLKNKTCGICGTDIHIWHGNEPAKTPVVLGHEFAGIIKNMGKEVERFSIGDRVSVNPNISCGVCSYCSQGKVNLCSNLLALGVDLNGGFAEYTIVPESQLYHIPSKMTWEEASMVEPLACCIRGIDRINMVSGQSVCIIGGGSIGLLMLQLVHFQGASKIYLSEKNEYRRNIGKTLGADYLIDPIKVPLNQYFSKKEAPDIVIECVGSPKTQEESINIVKPGGTVELFGCGPLNEKFSISSYDIYSREITILGSALNPFTHSRAISLIVNKRIILDKIILKNISIEDIPNYLSNGLGEEDIKVVVKMN